MKKTILLTILKNTPVYIAEFVLTKQHCPAPGRMIIPKDALLLATAYPNIYRFYTDNGVRLVTVPASKVKFLHYARVA